MNKKRMIIVTSIILSVIVISFGIVKLYQSYAIANDMVDANSSPTIDINITEDNTINVPANGYSNVFYMVSNTSPGTVSYGIGYSGTSVTVKAFSTSVDPASGLIEENGRKYVKLRLENSSSTSQSVALSTILGYAGDSNLLTPSGITLVTEVYTPPPTLVNTITNLYTSASKTTVTNNSITYNYVNIYDTDDDSSTSGGLMSDRLGGTTTDYDAGNIRYYGGSPNNYIYFNCSDYNNQSDSTCEKWRIIGVFDDKVKIMRNENIGTAAYDDISYIVMWNEASLMKLLNPTNYYSDTTSKSSYYYSSLGDFSSIGIKNDTTRNMIYETIWKIQKLDDYTYPNLAYVSENNSTITWTGKISLPSAVDYGYASDFNYCQTELSLYSDCISNNWMNNIVTDNNNDVCWLYSGSMILENGNFRINEENVEFFLTEAALVVPTFYLYPDIVLKTGNGSLENPYQLLIK